jgi:hypothetical protein
MSSKAQRQNQHAKFLEKKIRKFGKKGKCTKGLTKELDYVMGESRPEFKTGKAADPRLKKVWHD